MEINSKFSGHLKVGKWFLQGAENRLTRFLVPFIPQFIETYHLTLMTLLWSLGVILSGYLAQSDIRWLWLSSLCIFLQYITDLLDGAVGRERGTGLIKWGYFMDHFLDYIFFTALVMSYAFIFPIATLFILMALAFVQIGFMVNMFLSFATTNSFTISFLNLGPTEIRVIYILFNIYLIFWGVDIAIWLMPYFVILSAAALAFLVYKIQKGLWEIDMENKKTGFKSGL